VSTVYALRVRCLKRHTCTGCGCVYRVRREITVQEKARSEETAAKAATKRIHRQLTTEPNTVACPDCGQFQPDLVGHRQAGAHGLVTLLSVAVAVTVAVGASLFGIPNGRTGTLLAGVAVLAAVAHIILGNRNPNAHPADNRVRSRKMEDDGELDVTRGGDREQIRAPVGPFTRLHILGVAGVLLAIGGLLVPAAARERPADAVAAIRAAPGETLELAFSDTVEVVNGLWRGTPKVTVQNPQDFGNQPPAIVAISNDATWPATVKIEAGRDRIRPQLWAKIAIPDEDRLAGKTLELKVDLEVSYPGLDNKIVRDRRTNVWKDVNVKVSNETLFGRIWQMPARWVGVFFGTLTLAFAGLYLTALGHGLARLAEPVKAEVEEIAAARAAARDERPVPSDPHAAARLERRAAEAEAEEESSPA
jgi:hypothetical protein